jgi:hypothetical protein
MRLRWFFDCHLSQLTLHSFQFVHLLFDGTNSIEVLGELVSVRCGQSAPHRLRVFENQVGDISICLDFLRTEHPAIGFPRISHGRSDMAGSIPRDIVEVDRFLVVFVAVAAEF